MRRIGRLTNLSFRTDGGGVSGLSSLLILQTMMKYINAAILEKRRNRRGYEIVGPQQIFDLVAGTSTGGLITIILGKLGMTIEECIKAYHELSRSIFAKKHMWARVAWACSDEIFWEPS